MIPHGNVSPPVVVNGHTLICFMKQNRTLAAAKKAIDLIDTYDMSIEDVAAVAKSFLGTANRIQQVLYLHIIILIHHYVFKE